MNEMWQLLLLMALAPALYFLPTIIAVFRHKRNVLSISIINFAFGWTFLGWIICFAWAFMHDNNSNA